MVSSFRILGAERVTDKVLFVSGRNFHSLSARLFDPLGGFQPTQSLDKKNNPSFDAPLRSTPPPVELSQASNPLQLHTPAQQSGITTTFFLYLSVRKPESRAMHNPITPGTGFRLVA